MHSKRRPPSPAAIPPVAAGSTSWLRRVSAMLVTACLPLALGVACRPAVADGQPAASAGTTSAAPSPAASPVSTDPVKVRLSWDASGEREVVGYKVSWGDMPGRYTESTSLAAPASSVELSLSPRPAPYFVAVQARSGAGQVSTYSNEFVLDLSSGTPRAVTVVNTGGPGQSQAKTAKAKKPRKSEKEKAEAAERKRLKKEQKKAKRQKAQTPP